MAGSPKKRARKKARSLEEQAAETPATLCPPAAGIQPQAAPPALLPPALDGEILPPEPPDVTNTAMKRAMRARAREYADKAIEVLSEALGHSDVKVRVSAANALLDRAYGKPVQEIDLDAGGLTVVIQKFGEGV